MNLSRKGIIHLLGVLSVFCFVVLSFSTYEAASREVKDGGSFYDDVPGAKEDFLGAAGYFHIFANQANLRNHTNGNVATRELSGDANFGTSNIGGTEYNYAQKVTNINAASGIRDHTKMVFGTNVRVDLSEYHRPKVNGKSMDRVSGDDVYQDKQDNLYIDFDKEFEKLDKASQSIISRKPDKVYSDADFEGQSERVVDVSQFKSTDVYLQFEPDVLEQNTPLIIKNLEKNSQNGAFKNVYITVNTGNSSRYTVNTQVIFEYTDGSRRGNKETTDFSDSTVLWTFSHNNSPFSGNINLRNTWLGSLLAPHASVDGGSNIDGNIIVDNFKGAGETHSWHWQKNKGLVRLKKIAMGDGNKTLEGAEFSLYQENGVLVKEKLRTEEDGYLEVSNLPFGSYYFVETKAPDGYELSTKKYPFKIDVTNNNQTIEVIAENKEKEEPTGSVIIRKTSSTNSDIVLQGAEFSLYTKSGKLVSEKLTTDESGLVRYDNLPVGEYYIVETKAPDGYELTDKKFVFKIEADKTSQVARVEVSNQEKPALESGAVELRKVSQSNQKIPLKGAEFSLFDASGKLIKEKLSTNQEGLLKVSQLAVGSYYFVETKAPDGYEIATKKYPFEIKAGMISQISRLTVTNKEIEKPKKGSVRLTKSDEETKEKRLKGAEFSLYTSEGNLVKDNLVTDENGMLEVTELALGSYYFMETKAPSGYKLSDKKYTFDITEENAADMIQLEATNQKEVFLGSVLLEKLDASDSSKKLSGAEFSLYTSEGKLLQAGLLTDTSGILKVDQLVEGSYYFVETKSPDGYALLSEKIPFEIKADQIETLVPIQVTNEKIVHLGSVVLVKADSGNEAVRLSGAEFSLYTANGELVKENLVTDQTGELKVANLIPGDYYFIETKAPAGYEISQEKYEFSIKEHETSEVTQVKALNTQLPKVPYVGSVILTKVDSLHESQVLLGAEFSLYKASGELVFENLVTDTTGQLKVENLSVGDYYFVETKAPIGYELSKEKHEFSVKEETTSKVEQVRVSNKQIPKVPYVGSVVLTKTDESISDKVLSGAEFSLYKASGELVFENLVTDTTGQLKVENLSVGDYYFVETKAPISYELSKEKHEFSVKEETTSKVEQVRVSNKQIPKVPYVGSVVLTKTDESISDKVLSGAEFSLYKASGELVFENLVTDTMGQLKVENLSVGDYYFVETKAPIGYELSKEKHEFSVKEEATTKVTQVSVTNKQIPEVPYVGSVSLTKIDKNNKQKVLSGAEFSLYTANGKLIKEKLVTNETGMLLVDNLNEGSYYFIETKAPLGYKLSKEKYPFEIKKEQKTKMLSLTVTNEPIEIVPVKPIEPTKPVQPVKPIMPTTYLTPNIPSGGQGSKTLPKTGETINYFVIVGWTLLLSGSYLWWVKSRKQFAIVD